MPSLPPGSRYVCQRCIRMLSGSNGLRSSSAASTVPLLPLMTSCRQDSIQPQQQRGLRTRRSTRPILGAIEISSNQEAPQKAHPRKARNQREPSDALPKAGNGASSLDNNETSRDRQPATSPSSQSGLDALEQYSASTSNSSPLSRKKRAFNDPRDMVRKTSGEKTIALASRACPNNSTIRAVDPYPLPIQKISPPDTRFHRVPPAPPILRPSHLDPVATQWYWETLRPSPSELAQANKFFKDANPTFLRSVNKFREWPQSDVPEVAFVGRSNVGKSSLLNAIVGADLKTKVSDKELARTSKHPGHTKMMNLYGVGGFDHGAGGVRIRPPRSGTYERIMGRGGLVIVDLPGYGEGSHQEWGLEILKYLTQRNQLQRTFILVDALAGLKDKDRSLLASLRLAGVSHQVILSKLDRVYIPDAGILSRVDGRRAPKPMGSLEDLAVVMQGIREQIQPRVGGGALGELLACSSEVRCNGRLMGMDAVRYAILQAASHQFERVPEKKIREVKAVPPLIKKHAGLPPAKIRPLRTHKKSSPGSWKTARLD